MNVRLLDRLGLRGRLMVAVVGAIAVVLAALTAGFNLVLGDRLAQDADSVAIARASAALTALKVGGGRISLTEAPDTAALDSPIWVFRGPAILEQPRANPADARSAAALAGGPRRFFDVPSTNTRLYAVPVVLAGRRVGTVVSAVSLTPYAQTAHTALVGSIALATLAFLAVALAARWLISRALRPVSLMTHQAADWSEHDLMRRFSLGEPRDELTELAATLDALLGRLATSLEHEQRLTAELSHELRTPLSHITAEAQHALLHARHPDQYRAGYEQILNSAAQMSRILETLIAAARSEHDPHRATSDAAACAGAAVAACRPLADAYGIEIEVSDPPEPSRVAVQSDLAQRILSPLVENACRYAAQRVRVSLERRDGSVSYIVDDDGPGIEPGTLETIFKPGQRGHAPAATAVAVQGAGLGLALARRLARGAGGDVTAAEVGHGARFIVQLPCA